MDAIPIVFLLGIAYGGAILTMDDGNFTFTVWGKFPYTKLAGMKDSEVPNIQEPRASGKRE